jgi:flagellar FliJ protein
VADEGLDAVAQLARLREQQAAEATTTQRTVLASEEGRLYQLQSFREEYEARLTSQAGEGIDARTLRDYRNFLLKLNEAIALQVQRVAEQNKTLGERRQELRRQSGRRESVDGLIERQRDEQRRDADRREQRIQDEASTQRHQSGEGV